MCLLILKPAGLSIPEEYLTNAAISNPHGSGVAIARGDNIVIQKDPSWRAKEIKAILQINQRLVSTKVITEVRRSRRPRPSQYPLFPRSHDSLHATKD